MEKPGRVFDRDVEWTDLVSFASRPRPGLAVVRGRRRHGKSILLRALAEAVGGFYHQAIRGVPADQRRDLATAWADHTRGPLPAFEDWTATCDALLATGGLVILDEFPYLTDSAPELASVLQRAVDRAPPDSARLLVCGSSMAVMTSLLVGQAPLRGRAQLELDIGPFDHQTMAAFLDLDPVTAFPVHAVVGGVPGYVVDLLDGQVPDSAAEVERWLLDVVASPRRPLVHEARAMLDLEGGIRDPGLYASVLGVMAAGATRVSEIASRLGRRSDQIAHSLTVLADLGVARRREDALGRRRPTWHITDPLLRLYSAVLRPNWALVEQADTARLAPRLLPAWRSQVLGPHLEHLAREWALRIAPPQVIGGTPTAVGAALVDDRAARRTHEVDLVATEEGRVIALGEVKLRRIGPADAERLAHVRRLVPDAQDAHLILVSATGFTAGDWSEEVHRIDLQGLYGRP